MLLNFSKFKSAITRQFGEMVKHDLFCTEVAKDDLWETYLGSFPEGTNPVFRERTKHDCSCCRQFIHTVGNLVAVIDGKVISIWDMNVDDPAYQAVANSLSALVKSKPIKDQFLHNEYKIGTDRNYEEENGVVRAWDHFHVEIPRGRNSGKNYYCKGEDIATKLGEARSLHDVFLRSLKELTRDSLDTVMEIINQGSIYRGNEFKFAVDSFLKLKKQFDKLPEAEHDIFAWANFDKVPAAVARIRNTAIGTLLVDLSEGIDLENAVGKFESSVMAPANYKRPTALVSKQMVEAAKKTVEELGLTSALGRRYAHLGDISINDIIFADRTTRLRGDVFDNIATKTIVPKNLDKVETVSIEKFISDIVPRAESIEVMMENRHVNNLVSLIAPVDDHAKSMFKWNNRFSWSYNGDMADSIKERVKKAGGNVVGDLCCRLAWYNHDDLDFHMRELATGHEIYYGTKHHSSPSGGRLDVDMNAGTGTTREPVENIFYGNRRTMKEGIYELSVHNFAKRESSNVGFEVEIDYLGDVLRFVYEKAVSDRRKVVVATFKYSHTNGMEIIESLPSSTASKTLWGLKTQDFQKVNVLMNSPNHWDGEQGVGNKHYFFMLDGCINDGQARGFFNEFLNSDLDKHRKVIEMVGSKMKTEETTDQLSGLGFSDTKRAELLIRVKGNFTRTIKVLI